MWGLMEGCKHTLDTLTRANLEFPLSRHNFGINTRDFDASVQTGLVMCFNNIATEDLVGTNTTVIWTLRTREAILGPAVWPVIMIK